jgi:hypothetical protein
VYVEKYVQQTNNYERRYYFNFPIVNIPPAYGIYIPQLKRKVGRFKRG